MMEIYGVILRSRENEIVDAYRVASKEAAIYGAIKGKAALLGEEKSKYESLAVSHTITEGDRETLSLIYGDEADLENVDMGSCLFADSYNVISEGKHWEIVENEYTEGVDIITKSYYCCDLTSDLASTYGKEFHIIALDDIPDGDDYYYFRSVGIESKAIVKSRKEAIEWLIKNEN